MKWYSCITLSKIQESFVRIIIKILKVQVLIFKIFINLSYIEIFRWHIEKIEELLTPWIYKIHFWYFVQNQIFFEIWEKNLKIYQNMAVFISCEL